MRLSDEKFNSIVRELPSEKPQVARSDICYAIENLNEEYPDDKIPLLIPEGGNHATFLAIGESVQASHDSLEDVELYDFWIDVWQIYTEAYQ